MSGRWIRAPYSEGVKSDATMKRMCRGTAAMTLRASGVSNIGFFAIIPKT
jgi:hypothetical protein